jgi:hypothetical protein
VEEFAEAVFQTKRKKKGNLCHKIIIRQLHLHHLPLDLEQLESE